MKRFIDIYVAASGVLFKLKKTSNPPRNITVDLFANLTPGEADEIENGRQLPTASIERLASETGLTREECQQRIEHFLYWRHNSLGLKNSGLESEGQ